MEIELYPKHRQWGFQWLLVQLHPQLQGFMQIKVIHEEKQVGAGVPREGTLSKEIHNILFKFYHTSLVGDAGDLITSVTVLNYELVTTIQKENHQ